MKWFTTEIFNLLRTIMVWGAIVLCVWSMARCSADIKTAEHESKRPIIISPENTAETP